MSLAHLAFLRDGLQLPYLPHLREEERDPKYTLRLLTKDVAFLWESLSTLTAHRRRGPGKWLFCGQHRKQVVWYLLNIVCRGGELLPLLQRMNSTVVCTQERQGRAAICCWKDSGSSFSPGTNCCRWLIHASDSHPTVSAHRAVFHRGH